MESIIENIIATKATCYFISPHLDDAAYSAGALMSTLSKTNKVIVVNVITSSGASIGSRWAKRFLKKCGYSDAKQLFHDRVIEDSAALGAIADSIVNLGFTDAAWRQKTSIFYRTVSHIFPDLSAIYSTLRLRINPGKVSPADNGTIKAIKSKLLGVVETDNSVVFCPLALGRHIDHVIVRLVCDEIFTNVIHWSDYPYNVGHGVEESDKPLKECKFSANLTVKEELVKKYVSQYEAVIGDNSIDRLEEYFYLTPDATEATDA